MNADDMNKIVLEEAAQVAREILRDDPAAIHIIAAYGSKMVWLGAESVREEMRAKDEGSQRGGETP